MITKIKVCGMTNAEDVNAAIRLGVDAIGFIFHSKSPRYVTIENAKKIIETINPIATIVGVFVDASRQTIEKHLQQLPIHILQFHGSETQQFCQSFARPYIKAIAMQGDRLQMQQQVAAHNLAQTLLFDTAINGKTGGTGQQFDYDLLPKCHQKMMIAGGLNPDNVLQVLQKVRPDVVDFNSGVESAAGKKDHALIAQAVVKIKSFQISNLQQQNQ